MTTLTSLIVFGDSLSYLAAGPWYQLCGGVTTNPEYPDPAAAGGQTSRFPFIVLGSDPVLRMMNTAISGAFLTGIGAGNGANIGQYRVDANIPTGYPEALTNGLTDNRPARRYILAGFYANISDADPAGYATKLVTYFNARKSAALAKGVTLHCMTMTVPSRKDGNGFVTEAVRHTFNNTYLRSGTWRTTNGIHVADLASVPLLDATDAADNATYFSDTVHWTQAGAALAVPVIRSTLNAIIAGTAP